MNSIERTKELAQERNISLLALAEKSNISYSTLRKAAQRQSQLRLDTIERICDGLDITVKQFFMDEDA